MSVKSVEMVSLLPLSISTYFYLPFQSHYMLQRNPFTCSMNVFFTINLSIFYYLCMSCWCAYHCIFYRLITLLYCFAKHHPLMYLLLHHWWLYHVLPPDWLSWPLPIIWGNVPWLVDTFMIRYHYRYSIAIILTVIYI